MPRKRKGFANNSTEIKCLSDGIGRQRAGLREGVRVEIEAEGDCIIISRASPRHVLADLLKGMTPEAMQRRLIGDRIKVARSLPDIASSATSTLA